MPLDPFFADRLKKHRAYLIAQARDSSIASVRRLLGRTTAMPASARSTAGSSPIDRERRAARDWDRKELAAIGIAGPAVLTVEHTVSATPDVLVRIYYPSTTLPTDPVPAAIAFFGSGFRIGGIDFPTTDAAYRRRAADAGVAVVAVAYALAPEHHYPVPVEQGYAVLDWLVHNGAELGIDAGRIALSGISSGGNIAAAVALMNRDRARHPLALQVLEVPVLDLTGGHIDLRPIREMGIPRLVATREMRQIATNYLGDRQRAREPYASPLLASSFDGLPPTVVLTAEYDPLRLDGEAFVHALRTSGIEASAVRYAGVIHDAHMFGGVLQAARRWHDDVVTALRRLHD